MDIASSNQPIIFRTNAEPVLKPYAWGGVELARWLRLPEQRIAEIWFCSTQSDGVSSIHGVSFARIVAANPKAMLGSRFTSKPTFSKILAKDQAHPQVTQIGFTEKIVGRAQEFIDCVKSERRLVLQLKEELNRMLDCFGNETKRQEAFEDYRRVYEAWVSEESGAGWTLGLSPNFADSKIAQAIRDCGFEVTIFGRLIDVRRQLTGYLNTIELKPGQVILSPTGYIHSIVGSHQTHPLENEVKNEAWYIFSAAKNTEGKDILFYYELQETSNTTYSLFDFPTPIVFKGGTVEMRKDVTKGLSTILDGDDAVTENDEAAIQFIAERTVKFEPTKPEDFVVNATIRNVDTQYQAVGAKAERAVDGPYRVMGKVPFVLDMILLNGSALVPAAVTVPPLDDSYSDIVVLEGEVTIAIDGREEMLTAGDAMFIPASDQVPRTVKASTHARLARSYPPPSPASNARGSQ